MTESKDPLTVAIEEIRALLGEAYSFQSTSPRAQENINAALDHLDTIESALPSSRDAENEAWPDAYGAVVDEQIVFASANRKSVEEWVGESKIEIRPLHVSAAPRAAADTEREALSSCSKEEVAAFEAWAEKQKYDMTTHPLPWLFLNEKTYAARQGWRAALEFARAALSQSAEEPLSIADRIRKTQQLIAEEDSMQIKCALQDELDEAQAALSQPAKEQEPFAWAVFDGEGGYDLYLAENNDWIKEKSKDQKYGSWYKPLFAAPVQQEAKRITELEKAIDSVLSDIDDDDIAERSDISVLALRNVRAGRPMYEGLDGFAPPQAEAHIDPVTAMLRDEFVSQAEAQSKEK